MKEKLYTMDLMDAVTSGEECMFCFLERKLEHNALDFVLRSSYMECDIREKTDALGFCRSHMKSMYDYGNNLGNAWILKTRMEYIRKQLRKQIEDYKPKKNGWMSKMKKGGMESGNLTHWIREQDSHCYICDRMGEAYVRIIHTFLYLLVQEPEYGKLLMESGGFCFHHFADVIDICGKELSETEKEVWMPKLFSLMEQNLERVQEDIDWLIEKYDYHNQKADWKTSKDAVPRAMQKLAGGHPADPVYKSK